ncbi:hypothetical protein Goklo_013611 [Gossypium klotzschianum]|uniref:RNase H type-1 domain-containing protein n=1 Tax=Gossypium klotzschianum TaxID=34286 RepID=A0A7J8U573_9ROSI|nr:hypothetical protein [Gossypium klotzschianum]
MGECLAWENGICQLKVENGNAFLIETIVEGRAADGQIMELCGINQMMCRGWKVCFHHVPRTHNVVADYMTKVMATKFTEIQVFVVPPHFVRDLVQADYFRFTRTKELIH